MAFIVHPIIPKTCMVCVFNHTLDRVIYGLINPLYLNTISLSRKMVNTRASWDTMQDYY